MKRAGMTERQLGKNVGVGQSSVSAWLRQEKPSEPPASRVFLAERALGLSPGFLSSRLGYVPAWSRGDRTPEELVAASDDWSGPDKDRIIDLMGRLRRDP